MKITRKIGTIQINLFIIIIFLIFIVLLIIFGYKDLEISKTIVNKDSSWCKFLEDYGNAPGYGLIIIAILILIRNQLSDLKKQKIVGYIGLLILLIIMTFGLIENDYNFVIFFGIMALFLLLFLIFYNKHNWNDYSTLAIVIVFLAIINPLLFVRITKFLVGRVRYNDLALDYSNFTNWFSPYWLDSNNNSFPSGHTAMGWKGLPFLFYTKKQNIKNHFKIIIIAL